MARKHDHDARNRLVEVKNDNGTSTTSDDFTIARYRYNGLHWRVRKWANVDPAQAAPSSGNDGTTREKAMFYDASWRLIEREVFDGFDPAAAAEYEKWNANRAEELFWGPHSIDDLVCRRVTTPVDFDGSDEEISATWSEAGPAGGMTSVRPQYPPTVPRAGGPPPACGMVRSDRTITTGSGGEETRGLA